MSIILGEDLYDKPTPGPCRVMFIETPSERFCFLTYLPIDDGIFECFIPKNEEQKIYIKPDVYSNVKIFTLNSGALSQDTIIIDIEIYKVENTIIYWRKK